jgi:hypothetical protein
MDYPWFLGIPTPSQLLTEESRLKLEVVRDQLYLMARVSFEIQLCDDDVVETQMGLCFENMALQIDEVLDGLTHSEQTGDERPLKH